MDGGPAEKATRNTMGKSEKRDNQDKCRPIRNSDRKNDDKVLENLLQDSHQPETAK